MAETHECRVSQPDRFPLMALLISDIAKRLRILKPKIQLISCSHTRQFCYADNQPHPDIHNGRRVRPGRRLCPNLTLAPYTELPNITVG